MSAKLPNYLRTYRKQAGFSQADLAFLLGCRSSAKVSRYERFSRQPNLQTVFIYEVVFQVLARDLFAGMFRDVERATLRRAQALARKLNTAKPDSLTARRLEALKALTAHAKGETHNYYCLLSTAAQDVSLPCLRARAGLASPCWKDQRRCWTGDARRSGAISTPVASSTSER